MNHQGNGKAGVVDTLSEFGSDVATLFELQAKLIGVDLKESVGRAVVPAILVALALGLLLACFPVALVGVAVLISSALQLRLGWAFLLTAGVALVVAALVLVLAGTWLRRSFDTLRRSKDELIRNLAWIRTVLVQSSRSTPRRS